ncbi:hypothetical protein [Aquamicrobium sp. LC103]|uniref:hypothetical protein n=1 Tax=Aquamicrobium sp. LC103 TaxID=1120658 RepID=UPI00063E962C|nr:hypothetical protein [Aquamicrobium sp. LC103]TKT78409.1 hypothetical protein XW59_012400 [Aquamicrobium sp. LC103]
MMEGLEALLTSAIDAWSSFGRLIQSQQAAWALLSSTAIVGALGAYFGSVGAQRIVSRENKHRRRREALMAVNAAHSLTTVVINQAAAVKKQYHLPAKERWDEQRQRVVDAGERTEVVEVALHFQTPPTVFFPINALADLIYGKLALNGRPLGALAELVQAEQAMTALTADFRAVRRDLEQQPLEQAVLKYLAIETPTGQDTRFRDLCHGFVDIIDDLLFFAGILGRDLLEYGESIREHASRRERRSLPLLNEPGKIQPGYEYLIPDHDHHKRWRDAHVMIRSKPKGSWRRLWDAVRP